MLVIVNPVAGRRRRRLLERVLRALAEAGCWTTVRRTSGPDAARDFAKAADRGAYDVIAVAGGDGTISEAVNGMGPDSAPLAIIPMGTANVVAREIGLGGDPAGIAAAILRGDARRIHPGVVGGRRFLQMASAGFDSHVVESVDLALKRWLGPGAYVWQGMVALFRYRFPPLRVTVDGRKFDAIGVIAANGRYYGGGFVAAPEAGLGHARFDVVLFQRAGAAGLLRYALALSMNRLARLPDVRIVQGREVRIDGPPEVPVQADGDLVAHLPVSIGLATDAVTLLHPAPEAAG